jgi:hypothetical protein
MKLDLQFIAGGLVLVGPILASSLKCYTNIPDAILPSPDKQIRLTKTLRIISVESDQVCVKADVLCNDFFCPFVDPLTSVESNQSTTIYTTLPRTKLNRPVPFGVPLLQNSVLGCDSNGCNAKYEHTSKYNLYKPPRTLECYQRLGVKTRPIPLNLSDPLESSTTSETGKCYRARFNCSVVPDQCRKFGRTDYGLTTDVRRASLIRNMTQSVFNLIYEDYFVCNTPRCNIPLSLSEKGLSSLPAATSSLATSLEGEFNIEKTLHATIYDKLFRQLF